MPQEWYQTIDDYALALVRANVELGGPAAALKVARAGFLASGPVALVYGAANVLALGALVAFDPAGLRDKPRAGVPVQEFRAALDPSSMQAIRELIELSSQPSRTTGLLKDDEGIIHVV